MLVTVKKWGNSAALRIPANVMQAMHLKLDDAVDIREENGCIVIAPLVTHSPDLATLLAAITQDNQHDTVDFGAPLGRELL